MDSYVHFYALSIKPVLDADLKHLVQTYSFLLPLNISSNNLVSYTSISFLALSCSISILLSSFSCFSYFQNSVHFLQQYRKYPDCNSK